MTRVAIVNIISIMSFRHSKLRCVQVAVDAVGDLFVSMGLGRHSGRIWATLYLSKQAAQATELAHILGVSAGTVSNALMQLRHLDIVRVEVVDGCRAFVYRSEVEMWEVAKKIIRDRLRHQLSSPLVRMKEAMAKDSDGRPDGSQDETHLEQLQHLVELGEFAVIFLEAFTDRTRVELKAAQKWLSVSEKLGGEPLSRFRKHLNAKSRSR